MRRWLKSDATFPFGHTAQRLKEKFGRDGLLVWMCMLHEGKRNVPEGTFTYVNEHHFWNVLGLQGDAPGFTPDEFLRYTGELHLTRKRRSGEVITITLTSWNDWQEDWRRDDDRERKSRKRRDSKTDSLRTNNGHDEDTMRTEREREKEIEKKAKANGLPFEKELATTALLEAIGLHDQSTAVVVRRFSSRLPVGAIHKVLESLETNDPRNRAAYVVGSLKSEIAERGDGNAA